jgi:hypothetical protein
VVILGHFEGFGVVWGRQLSSPVSKRKQRRRVRRRVSSAVFFRRKLKAVKLGKKNYRIDDDEDDVFKMRFLRCFRKSGALKTKYLSYLTFSGDPNFFKNSSRLKNLWRFRFCSRRFCA